MKKLAIYITIFIMVIFILSVLSLKPKKVVKVHPAVKGKIAIVLDDWGYHLNTLPIVEDIKYPLTASVLPNIAYSRRVSEELHSRGYEVILHLPMEPEEKYSLEDDTILTTMNKDEILAILNKALQSIRYAKGISNHMGSRATSDPRVMEIVLRELKRKHLYFLDSFVTAKSVCRDTSIKLGLKPLKRGVFRDNIEKPEYIKQQIEELKNKARLSGVAIGIGHDRKITLEVLREVMPELAREGYKFIYLSELAQSTKR